MGAGKSTPVAIVEQPVAEQIVCVGNSVTISITTEGTPPQCVWQFSEDGQQSWRDVDSNSGRRFEGADTRVLRVLDVQKSDRGFYRCVVRSKQQEQETLVSTPSALIVVSLPVITSSTKGKCSVPCGTDATLHIEAEGVSLAYQWQRNNIITSHEEAAARISRHNMLPNYDGILATAQPSMKHFNVKPAIPHLRKNSLITNDHHERLLLPDKTNADMVNLVMVWLPQAGDQYLERFINSLRGSSEECPAHNDIADELETALRNAKDGGENTAESESSGEEWVDVCDGDSITGSSEACLRIHSARASDASYYRCRVYNDAGEVFSTPVRLVVVEAPKIVKDLASVKVKRHDRVTLSVVVECEGAMCFEWEKRATNSTEWQEVTSESKYKGQGTPALVIPDIEEEDVGLFRCHIFSAGGNILTKEASVTTFETPRIIDDLNDVAVKLHDRVTLKVAAVCEETMTYMWQKRVNRRTKWANVSSGSKYSGQGTPTLVITDVEDKDEGLFRCVVSSEGGETVTREASLRIIRAPKIIEDLRDVRVMFRDQITLEVVAECQEQMEYKWQMKIQKSMDWQDVSYRGQGTPTLVIPGVEDEDEGLFRCVVSSEGGETVTREASLRIIRAPKIIEDLRDVRAKFRDQITLEVVAECQEQMEYKWQMKIQKSMDWQDVSYRGQGTPTLVIPGVEDEDEGLFRCVVSSEGGETVTREASLRIIRAPKIIEDLRDVRAVFHDQVTLEVVAECRERMEYNWQMKIHNSMDWQDVSYRGQGTPTLVIPGVEDEDEGLFRCVVSSEGGVTVTREASLKTDWRLSCDSLSIEDLSAQLAKLTSSTESNANLSCLTELIILQKSLNGFKGDSEQYQTTFATGNVERQLMKQGPLDKCSRSVKCLRFFFLFSDVLVVTEKKSSKQYLFKQVMPIHFMQVEESSKHSDCALWFDVYSVTRSFSLVAKSAEEKKEWIKELNKCIEAYNLKIGRDPLISDCNHLEHAPINVPDDNVTKCQLCQKQFTFTFRRHHCRKCGKVFCDPCSRARVRLPSEKKAVRVCVKCNSANAAAANVGSQLSPLEEPTVLERPASSADVLKRGYVHAKCTKSSARMWYELDSKGVLYIYKASNDPSAERTVPLVGYGFVPSRGELTLRLTHPVKDELFTVEDVDEFDQWESAIRKIWS